MRFLPKSFRPRRFLPTSLAGQIVALTLAGVVLSQIILLSLFTDERRARFLAFAEQGTVRRLVDIARLMSAVEPSLHPHLLKTMSDRRLRIIAGPLPAPVIEGTQADPALAERARATFEEAGIEAREIVAYRGAIPAFATMRTPQEGRPGHAQPEHRPPGPSRHGGRHARHGPKVDVLAFSLTWGEGQRLTGIARWPQRRPVEGRFILLVSTITALVLAGIMVALARRIARPLKAMGEAAGRLGLGENHRPLDENGPDEVRRTVAAFNRMGARLDRMLNDQRRMVAAVGHDLRTPITALRLRTEFVEDDENRQRMGRILDEMQAMADGLLALSRAEQETEAVRPTDLEALLQSVTDDMSDLGMDVALTVSPPLIHGCRPASLTRAVRNLAENAARYGERARVEGSRTEDGGIRIRIDDDGPGMPEEALERVFDPFTRLETSRNEATGGMGLGLTIARMMVEREGGRVTLRNRPEGGLTAEILLPPAP